MSRPDDPVEPSMDEILSSIRKIIAEEPIGTRPEPALGPTLSPPARADADRNGSAAPSPPHRPQGTGTEAPDTAYEPLASAGNGAHARKEGSEARPNGSNRWTFSNPFTSKPATPTQPDLPSLRPALANGAAAGKPAQETRRPFQFGSGSDIAKPDDGGQEAAAEMTPAVNAVEPKISEGAEQILSEVRAKLDRQLSASRGEVAERAAAPLGLKSIRDAVPAGKPAVDANAARKPVANGLVARTAAAVGGPDGLGLNGTRLERPPAYSSPPTGSSLFPDAAASRPAVSEATKRETRSSPVMFDEQAEKVASAEQAGGNTTGSEAALTGAAPITAGGRTLDDVVADMLRPMLRQWLDENLPGMIEKALREEMAKTGRKGDKPAS